MKTIFLFVSLFAVISASTNDMNVDTLASYSPVGPPLIPIVTVINNAAQLNVYCEATGYDTSILFAQPDFTTKTIIGLLTMTGGGNRIDYRTLKMVYCDIDTIVLEVKPDSQVFDVGMSIQAGCHVLLFAILKTDKPVIMKMVDNTSVRKSYHSGTILRYAQWKPIGSYSLQGRMLSAKNGHATGVFILSGGKKTNDIMKGKTCLNK